MTSTSASALAEYFRITRDQLERSHYAEVNIVLGNESCDLDSAISAITYSAFLFYKYNKIKCKVCTRGHRDETLFTDDIFVPVLNVDRQDFGIKTEVVWCLRQYGISEVDLMFRNDEKFIELTQNSRLKVVLVDHHVLSDKDNFLTSVVTEVIDHRPMDYSKWPYNPDTRSRVEIVGSCASLVTERIKEQCVLFVEEDTFFNLYIECADMLHSTIILDTVNFCTKLKKGTPKDVEIVLFLENILKTKDVDYERKSKLDHLVDARKDVSTLTPPQLLRKDLKIFEDIMVPSFPLLVKDFLARPEALQSVSEALNKTNCSIALLLGMDLTNGLKRDMAAYSLDSNQAEKLFKFLQDWQPSLELIQEASLDNVHYGVQNNLSASRKQYVPALNKFLTK